MTDVTFSSLPLTRLLSVECASVVLDVVIFSLVAAAGDDDFVAPDCLTFLRLCLLSSLVLFLTTVRADDRLKKYYYYH